MPLSSQQVTAAIKSGRNHKLGDGHNLYLVTRRGHGFWVYQFRDGKVIRSKGLGSAADVTLAAARRAREAFAVARREGLELAGQARREGKGPLFSKVRDEFLDHNASLWGVGHRQRNRFLLTTYAKALDSTPVNRITPAMVADVLRPIWTGPGDNRGSKLRALIENVINGHVTPNPAAWDMLRIPEHKLELKRAEVKGHTAMPAAAVPAFVMRLDMTDVADRATLFVILTGVRRQEAIGATWSEFDLANKRWMIPAARMKNRKDHFVPLSDPAIACLGEPSAPDAIVFPSRRGGMLGHDALLLSRFGVEYTLHGFRSTLADWAEENGYRTNVIQMFLAHRKKSDDGRALGSQDLAYMRTTLFDERRKLHDTWAAFVTGNRN
jgi:integrase